MTQEEQTEILAKLLHKYQCNLIHSSDHCNFNHTNDWKDAYRVAYLKKAQKLLQLTSLKTMSDILFVIKNG